MMNVRNLLEVLFVFLFFRRVNCDFKPSFDIQDRIKEQDHYNFRERNFLSQTHIYCNYCAETSARCWYGINNDAVFSTGNVLLQANLLSKLSCFQTFDRDELILKFISSAAKRPPSTKYVGENRNTKKWSLRAPNNNNEPKLDREMSQEFGCEPYKTNKTLITYLCTEIGKKALLNGQRDPEEFRVLMISQSISKLEPNQYFMLTTCRNFGQKLPLPRSYLEIPNNLLPSLNRDVGHLLSCNNNVRNNYPTSAILPDKPRPALLKMYEQNSNEIVRRSPHINSYASKDYNFMGFEKYYNEYLKYLRKTNHRKGARKQNGKTFMFKEPIKYSPNNYIRTPSPSVFQMDITHPLTDKDMQSIECYKFAFAERFCGQAEVHCRLYHSEFDAAVCQKLVCDACAKVLLTSVKNLFFFCSELTKTVCSILK